MAIGTPNVGTYTEATAATSTSVPFPATVNAGDLLVLVGSAKSLNLVTVPSGWTSQVSFSNTGNTAAPDLLIATAFAAGTEGGTSLTVTHPNVASSWQILGFSGVDPTTPIDIAPATVDQSTSASSTPIASQSVVTGGATIVYAAAANSGVVNASPPTGYTETGDRVSGTSALEVAYIQSVAAGATGTIANTWTTSQKNVGAVVVLRPAVAPTGAAAATWTATVSATGSVSGASPAAGASASFAVSASAAGVVGVSATASLTVTSTNNSARMPTPHLDVNFDDGTTGGFNVVQGATVRAGSAYDGANGVRLAPDGSGFATLTYTGEEGTSHAWAAFRGRFRIVTKTNVANTFTDLIEIGNALTSAPKGQFTVYTNSGDLGIDFNTTDFAVIDPAYGTGTWHLLEAVVFFGATTFTARVRYDGTEYVHTSANTQTPTTVKDLWVQYPSTVTDQTVDWDKIRFWAGDYDSGYLLESLTAGTYVGSGSIAAAAGLTASGRMSASGTAATNVSVAMVAAGSVDQHFVLFTPPERTQYVLMQGSLRYSYPVSSTVWRDADGVWHAQEVPYDGDLAAADLILTSSGPVLVSEDIAAELTAAGIGTIT